MTNKKTDTKPEAGESKYKTLPLENLVNSDLFDMMKSVIDYHLYIGAPLKRLAMHGINSQNVMKLLDYPGISSEQRLDLHKLIFACEGLVKNADFEKLKDRRVELICAKYRDKSHQSTERVEGNFRDFIRTHHLTAKWESFISGATPASTSTTIEEKIKKLIEMQERSAVRYKACFGEQNPGGEQIYEYFALQLKELLTPPNNI